MFFKKLSSSLGEVLKNPLKLLPTLVIGITWIIIGFLGACFKEMPLYLKIASFFTFAQGGLYGGALAAVGGILGKVVVAAFLSALILPIFDKKVPFSGLGKGFKGLFAKTAMQGISDVSQFLGGLGVALVLYGFMNSRQSLQESLVGIVAVFLLLDNIGKKNGLITSLVFDGLKLVSGGKSPSSAACRRFLKGLTIGFAISVGLSALPYRPCVLIGIPCLLLAFIFSLFKKRRRKLSAASAMMLAIIIGIGYLFSAGLISFSLVSYAAGDRWVDPYDEFAVDNIFKLLPKLKDSGAEMIKVSPNVYNNLGKPVELAIDESFSIDLRNGAKTEYTLNIDESNTIDGTYSFIELKLLFTGDTGSPSLFKVASEWTEYATSDGRILNQGEIDTCTVYSNSGYESFLHDKKCIKIDCGIAYGIEFYPEQVYLTLNSNDDVPDGNPSGTYELALKDKFGKKVSDITLQVFVSGSEVTIVVSGDNGAAQSNHTIKGRFLSDSKTFYGDDSVKMLDTISTMQLSFEYESGSYVITGAWGSSDWDNNEIERWFIGPDYPDIEFMTTPETSDIAPDFDEKVEADKEEDKEEPEAEPKEESKESEVTVSDNFEEEDKNDDDPSTIGIPDISYGPIGDIIRWILEGDENSFIHIDEIGSINIGFVGATVSSIAGSAAGAAGAGASTGGESAVDPEGTDVDLGNYISRDDDGDLNVKDPATGENRIYVSNGDGTYTNPLSGATYTVNELKESVSSIRENAELIKQDQSAAKQAIKDQREANRQLSQDGQEYLQQKWEGEAKLDREIQLDHMWQKYGGERGDEKSIREAMAKQQDVNVKFQKQNNDYAQKMDNIVKGLEITQTVADTGVDVLATVTGQQGIKTAYTIGKNYASRMSDAYVNKKDMVGAFAMAGFDSLTDIGLDKAEAAGFHILGNTAADCIKNTTQNLYDGKDWDDGLGKAALTGYAKGTVAKLGDVLSGPQGAHTQEQLKNDLNMIKTAAQNGAPEKTINALSNMRVASYINNKNAEKVVNAVSTFGVDMGKNMADDISESFSD